MFAKISTRFENHYLFINLICCCLLPISNSLNVSNISRSIVCLPKQSSALLNLKKEFAFERSINDDDTSSYPRMKYWNAETDCCIWDGITCDMETGNVIGINLSNSWLKGPLCPNSSLFNFLHIQRLNLASNNFAPSSIPKELAQLSRLTHLNLSCSMFVGYVPSEISLLTKLVSLDLSSYSTDKVILWKVVLTKLIQNMTNLRQLHLNLVNIHSSIPSSLGNLSSLTSLSLRQCDLLGEFPKNIFHLSNIEAIDLSRNINLGSLLPEFNSSNKLKSLKLEHTNFSGRLPESIGNLKFLNVLHLSNSYFSGNVPTSLWNMSQLKDLYLSGNKFNDQISSILGNLAMLKNLEELGLSSFIYSQSSSSSFVLSELKNLTRLKYLHLSDNFLTGQFPMSLANFTQLFSLDLSHNQLTGTIPSSINIILNSIRNLYLDYNSFTGVIPSSLFKISSLTYLTLSSNQLTGSLHLHNISSSHLESLLLDTLDLSNNKLEGKMPKWFWTLSHLNLSYNVISGFEQAPQNFSWRQLVYLDMRSNSLHGSLPVPPLSISYYFISENNLIGKIHPSFCKLSNLIVLDVSNNNLSGSLPDCLGNFSSSLQVLQLKGNNFEGEIPKISTINCNMKTLDISHNKLQGEIPQSLNKCGGIEVLNLGHNQLNDTFPFWLQNLPELKILVLRSNKFYGPIGKYVFGFERLKIIDLSYNNFSGTLPADYFRYWTSMIRILDEDKPGFPYKKNVAYYKDSLTLIYKGFETHLVYIITLLNVIDLSNNNFQGKLPNLEDLSFLIVLNLSSNNFNGLVPSSLSDLTNLESLDLSRNYLYGRIPQELTSLTFLTYLNLSQNNLTGRIPIEKQFSTFENSSFEGNPGLCGPPLSNTCEKEDTPTSYQSEEDEGYNYFDWKITLIGYGCGLVSGICIGHVFITPRWIFRFLRVL